MAEKSRTCPACGGTMLYRLGELQCQQCSNAVTAAPEEPTFGAKKAPTFSAPSPITGYGSTSGAYEPSGYGGGPQHMTGASAKPAGPQNQWDPGAAYRNAPPPAPGGFTIGGIPPDSMFSGDARDRVSAVKDGLGVEKNIYFGLVCLGALFQVFGVFAVPHQLGTPVAPIISSVIGSFIGLGVSYWILFSEELWVKYACGGCVTLSMLILLFAVAAAANMDSVLMEIPGLTELGPLIWLVVAIQLGINAWFVSIMYRDVQRLNYR